MEITKFNLLILLIGLIIVFVGGFYFLAGMNIINFIILILESIFISIGLLLILLGIGMML